MPSAPVQRHETLYLSDGNVVLSAQLKNSDTRLLWRVHKSVLSLHSPVFAHMFSSPAESNPDPNEIYDGVPLIHMPDPAEDLEGVLDAFYRPSYSKLQPERLNPNTPYSIRSIFDFATKYEINNLRDSLVESMEADWPRTLAEWDNVESNADAIYREYSESKGERINGLFADDRLPEPASAIRFARECNVPTLLPAAFYHLSRIGSTDDWDKSHAVDRDPADRNPPRLRTARWRLLQSQDFMCLLRGRELNGTLFSSMKEGVMQGVDCNRVSNCERRIEEHAQEFRGRKRELLRTQKVNENGPLRELKECFDTLDLSQKGVCRSCLSDMETLVTAQRQKYWDDLSKTFLLA